MNWFEIIFTVIPEAEAQEFGMNPSSCKINVQNCPGPKADKHCNKCCRKAGCNRGDCHNHNCKCKGCTYMLYIQLRPNVIDGSIGGGYGVPSPWGKVMGRQAINTEYHWWFRREANKGALPMWEGDGSSMYQYWVWLTVPREADRKVSSLMGKGEGSSSY